VIATTFAAAIIAANTIASRAVTGWKLSGEPVNSELQQITFSLCVQSSIEWPLSVRHCEPANDVFPGCGSGRGDFPTD